MMKYLIAYLLNTCQCHKTTVQLQPDDINNLHTIQTHSQVKMAASFITVSAADKILIRLIQPHQVLAYVHSAVL